MSEANKLYLCHFGDYTFDLPVVNYDDYEKLDNKLDQINAVLDEIYKICDKELCKGEIKDLEMYCARCIYTHASEQCKKANCKQGIKQWLEQESEE